MKSSNFIKKLTSMVIVIALVVTSFMIGYVIQPNKSYAANSGVLDDHTGYWKGDSAGSIQVGADGTYVITLSSGLGGGAEGYRGTGGKIVGIARFNRGDELRIVIYEGGKAGSSPASAGGRAIALELNGKRILGAGGAGGMGYYSGPDGYKDYYTGYSVGSIDNNRFSSGGGGGRDRNDNSWAYYKYPGSNGVPGGALGGLTDGNKYNEGAAGANYLDTDVVELVSNQNGSTELYFEVAYKQVTDEDFYSSYNRIAVALEDIVLNNKASQVDNINSVEPVPHFTVMSNTEFDINYAGYDDVESASYQGVTVTNTSKVDGIINISGTISNPGEYRVIISGKPFMFKVLSEPTSSNVKVIFD